MNNFQDKDIAALKQQFDKDVKMLYPLPSTNELQANGYKVEAPQPLPDSSPKVLPFDLRMLPGSIRNYVADIAERQQCPIDFVAITSVCGLAAVLGRKALICPKQNDDWVVVPNLWGAIIGRPSAMKSPAMKAALEPLKRIDSDAAKQYEIAKEDHEINKEFAELSKATAKENAKKQIRDGNEKAAKATLQAASFSEPFPTRKRLVVNDASVEKLGELLNENPNGLILVRDELVGWLAKLTREEFQMERAFYLECSEGNGYYIYDRIGRGTINIKSTTLSVIGGIQPSRISPLIRDAIRGTSDDGLVQRLQLAVWPDDIGTWEWIDRTPNEKARESYLAAFENLYALTFNTNNDKPPCFRFTEEAQALFIEWMEEIQKIARKGDLPPALESHLLKMPKTVASLALLFQILGDDSFRYNEKTKHLDYTVGIVAISQALEWADYLKSHAERVYSIITNQSLEGTRLILKRMDKLKDDFTARDIQRKEWTGLTEIQTVEDALDYLVDYKHITSSEIPSSSSGGRPTIRYYKNPCYLSKVKK